MTDVGRCFHLMMYSVSWMLPRRCWSSPLVLRYCSIGSRTRCTGARFVESGSRTTRQLVRITREEGSTRTTWPRVSESRADPSWLPASLCLQNCQADVPQPSSDVECRKSVVLNASSWCRLQNCHRLCCTPFAECSAANGPLNSRQRRVL